MLPVVGFPSMAKHYDELVYLADQVPHSHVLLTYQGPSFQVREYTPSSCHPIEVAPTLSELRPRFADVHRMDPHRVDDIHHWWKKIEQINRICSLTRPGKNLSG